MTCAVSGTHAHQPGMASRRRAPAPLRHKRINTTAQHYVLDELEVGLTDDLY
jgi:hypothetical protein